MNSITEKTMTAVISTSMITVLCMMFYYASVTL